MNKPAKEALAETFLELAKSQGIERISVSKLCQLSHVSREAFYYHFQDKYELISWIYSQQKAKIMKEHFGKETWEKTVHRVLILIREYSVFYRNGFSDTSYQNLEKSMNDYTIEIFTNIILDVTEANEIDEEMAFFLRFDSHGAVSMTKEWVLSGMMMPEERLAYLIAAAMPQRMMELFNQYYEKHHLK